MNALDGEDPWIWYVCYGSNLSKKRFLDYLAGGKAASGKTFAPMQNPAPPERERRMMLPNGLFFAGHFDAYGGTAAAFIEVKARNDSETRACAYKVRFAQFIELWQRENTTADTPGQLPTPTWDEVMRGHDFDALPYGKFVVLAGFEDDPTPVRSFTSPALGVKDAAAPSPPYLKHIIIGLRERYPSLSDDDVVAYLTAVPGVRARFAPPELAQLIRDIRRSVPSDRATRVAVVGGGIAGLYCAYELAKRGRYDITVFEAASTFGGRIETVNTNLDGSDKDKRATQWEFGPMRFEPKIQDRLRDLVGDLGLRFDPFVSMGNDEAMSETAARRYCFRRDELRHRSDPGVIQVDPPRPLALLRLGVLRMFRKSLCDYLNIASRRSFDLNADTVAELPKGGRWDIGPYERGSRRWLQSEGPRTADANEWSRRVQIQEWLDHFEQECEDTYTDLRRNAVHRGRSLWDESFWNAMSTELSPAAIRYIRDEGTFYHLFPDNPNAVEWGIFWLRLFRTEACSLMGIRGGTGSLVERLVKELSALPGVRLRAAHEVVAVTPAADDTAVALRVRNHHDGHELRAEVDHCIFALPLAPLRVLSDSFPEPIQDSLNSGFGFPLLKCFLQVRTPWWSGATRPHTGAFGVPTRELHFHWWKTDAGPRGRVMLYTDHPATEFWKVHVQPAIHDRALVGTEPSPLKDALVYHLLIHARRQAHLRLAQLLTDTAANHYWPFDGSEGDVDRDAFIEKLENDSQEFCDRVQAAIANELQGTVSGWYRTLIGEPPTPVGLEHLERVLDVLRNPSVFQATFDAEQKAIMAKTRGKVDRTLKKLVGSNRVWAEFAKTATRLIAAESIDDQIRKAGRDVQLWGIRDWGRWPVGAGCHAWLPGARSWEIMDRIEAFGLVGRKSKHDLRNVHICGEALSDYQGFIEGALRSAARVVAALCDQHPPE